MKNILSKCSGKWMMMIAAVVILTSIVVLIYFMTRKKKENYALTGQTNGDCPATLTYNGNTYYHLTGYDTEFGMYSGSPSCTEFDTTSCIYGKKPELKTLNDDSCGVNTVGKTYNFCDPADLLSVHFKNISDPLTRQIIYVSKTNCNSGCNNKCITTYGMSADRTTLDVGSIDPQTSGFTNNDECLLKSDVSQVVLS